MIFLSIDDSCLAKRSYMALEVVRNVVESTCDFVEHNLGLTGKLVGVFGKWAGKCSSLDKLPTAEVGATGEIVGNATSFSKVARAVNSAIDSVPAFLGSYTSNNKVSDQGALFRRAVKDANDIAGGCVNAIRVLHATRFSFSPLVMARAATVKAYTNGIEGIFGLRKALIEIYSFNNKTTALEKQKAWVDAIQGCSMIALGILSLAGVTYALISLPANATLLAGTIALVSAAVSYLMTKRIEAQEAFACAYVPDYYVKSKPIFTIPRTGWMIAKSA